MILTGRDNKPIIINESHIVAVTSSAPTVTETISTPTSVHCLSHTFFVKETLEEVYLKIYSEPMPDRVPFVSNNKILFKAKEEEAHIQSNQASFTEPSRRRPTPKARQ